MTRTFRTARIVPSLIALALAAATQAQVTNATGEIGYNNIGRGWDKASSNDIGSLQQFFFTPNPPTNTLTPPAQDFIISNPSTHGSAEVKYSSSIFNSFSSSATSAILSGSGFASSDIFTQDTTSAYQSAAATQADVSLHLDSQALVTFSVDDFTTDGFAGCQFGFDNTYAGDFLTSGSHTISKLVGPGDHDFFIFFFTNEYTNFNAGDMHGYAGGNYNLTVDTQAVPEPATMAVLGLGITAVIRRRRKI